MNIIRRRIWLTFLRSSSRSWKKYKFVSKFYSVFLAPFCEDLSFPTSTAHLLSSSGLYRIPLCLVKAEVLVSPLCPTLQSHGLGPTRLLCPWNLQARILEWVPLPSSRGSSEPRGWIGISWVSCTVRQLLYHWATREAPRIWSHGGIHLFDSTSNLEIPIS